MGYCYNLGIMYENGQGVEKSYDEALSCSILAANQKNDWAQYALGLMYADGRESKRITKRHLDGTNFLQVKGMILRNMRLVMLMKTVWELKKT